MIKKCSELLQFTSFNLKVIQLNITKIIILINIVWVSYKFKLYVSYGCLGIFSNFNYTFHLTQIIVKFYIIECGHFLIKLLI